MKIFISIALILAQINALADESVLLKQRKTKAIGVPPFFGEITEEKDMMPGNDAFGFFYKTLSEKKGYCRLRAKISCEYALGIQKELKHTPVKIHFTDGSIEGKTDDGGIYDMIFRCEDFRKNQGTILSVKKHILSVNKLTEFPKEIMIPEADCR